MRNWWGETHTCAPHSEEPRKTPLQTAPSAGPLLSRSFWVCNASLARNEGKTPQHNWNCSRTSTKEVLPLLCTCCAAASGSSWLQISRDLGASTEHDAVPQNPGTGLPEALETAQQSQQGNPLWLVSWMLHWCCRYCYTLLEEPACSELSWDLCMMLSETCTRCILHKKSHFFVNSHLWTF